MFRKLERVSHDLYIQYKQKDMIKIILLVAFLLPIHFGFSQAAEIIHYQTIIVDQRNQIISNATVGLQIRILNDSIAREAFYTETHP